MKHIQELTDVNRLAKSVEEDRLFGQAVAGESEQRGRGDWPDWTTTCLVAFPLAERRRSGCHAG